MAADPEAKVSRSRSLWKLPVQLMFEEKMKIKQCRQAPMTRHG